MAVGWVWVWGIWEGPGLVWMGCVVFAVVLLWGGRLLEAGHQSSRQSVVVGEVGRCVGVRWRAGVDVGVLRTGQLQHACGFTAV